MLAKTLIKHYIGPEFIIRVILSNKTIFSNKILQYIENGNTKSNKSGKKRQLKIALVRSGFIIHVIRPLPNPSMIVY